MSSLKGPLFVLLGSLCFCISGTLQAFAPEGATPYVIAQIRMLLGAIFLFAVAIAGHDMPKRFITLPWRTYLVCSLLIIVAQVSFLYGMLKVGVAVGTVVDVGTTPIWSALILWVFFKKKPLLNWYVATTIAVVGIVLMNGIGEESIQQSRYLFFPMLAGFSYAIYLIENTKISSQIPPQVSVMCIMGLAAVILSPALFFFPCAWIVSSIRGISVALGFGVVTAGLAFSFTLYGLRHTNVAIASTLSVFEPMMASCLGIFLLGERATLSTYTGIFFVLLSVLILLVPTDVTKAGWLKIIAFVKK